MIADLRFTNSGKPKTLNFEHQTLNIEHQTTIMLKQYFKQAWQLLKENKLFSAIYIAGTALAISMVMIIAIYFYLKTGNIYPELERDRTLYVKMAQIKPKDSTDNSNSSSLLSLQTVKSCFYNLQTPEAVSASLMTFDNANTVRATLTSEPKDIVVKYTDTAFWRVFQFTFLEGKPFTQADFDSAIKTAVISQSLAKFLFPDENAEGKRFFFNDEEYRVCGVVKTPSYLLSESFAQVWLPYTLHDEHSETFATGDILGFLYVTILMKNSGDKEKVRDEVFENIKRYQANLTQNIDLLGQPDTSFIKSFREGNRPLKMNTIYLNTFLLLLIFMLVPAINLSGLNSGRMEKRLTEMGVRKAFGAPNKTLLNQVLVENLLLTLLGGAAGLLFSYLLIVVFKDLLLDQFAFVGNDYETLTNTASGVTPAMLLNFTVFFRAFVAALIVNVLSAIIPALKFTRKSIVNSLHEQYKH